MKTHTPIQLMTAFVLASLLSACQSPASGPDKTGSIPDGPYVSKVWVADNGDGTYNNPIVFADYSDPDLVRLGEDFYMTASSFNASPGLPILHSKDLVNWQLINHALPVQIPEEVYDDPQQGRGVWAPSMRFHNGEFFIYWGDPDFGVYMVKTDDPAGQWSEPHLVRAAKGLIDPSPLWDEDGRAYLVGAWAGSRVGVNSLLTIWEMAPEGTHLIDRGRNVFSGHDYHHTVEGPKFIKHDGYYYIFAPAGGVTHGWQLILRSRNIYGPYEEKVVLAQGTTDINGPHQGGYVETQSGEPWFVHFQDREAYGRILHLQPVRWIDGWPIMGMDNNGDGTGEPVTTFKKPDIGKHWPVMTPAETDEFEDGVLGLQWNWAGNQQVTWSIFPPGQDYLRLLAVPKKEAGLSLWNVPNLILQKFPAPDFTATTRMRFNIEWDVWQGKQAGMIITGNDYSYLAMKKDANGYYLEQILNKGANAGGSEHSVASVRLASNEVYLRVQVVGPDALCHFSYSEDGIDFMPIGIPHQAKPEMWSGAKVGIFCTGEPGYRNGGWADFDWFRVE